MRPNRHRHRAPDSGPSRTAPLVADRPWPHHIDQKRDAPPLEARRLVRQADIGVAGRSPEPRRHPDGSPHAINIDRQARAVVRRHAVALQLPFDLGHELRAVARQRRFEPRHERRFRIGASGGAERGPHGAEADADSDRHHHRVSPYGVDRGRQHRSGNHNGRRGHPPHRPDPPDNDTKKKRDDGRQRRIAHQVRYARPAPGSRSDGQRNSRKRGRNFPLAALRRMHELRCETEDRARTARPRRHGVGRRGPRRVPATGSEAVSPV